jgi:hypothetical protein
LQQKGRSIMTRLFLPPTELVDAALEELVIDTQRLYDARDKANPDECEFWKRQRNAFVKAQSFWLRGTRPTPTPSGYLVPSASRPGALEHRCYQIGGVWTCTCEAGERGEFHWHAALVNAIELAFERQYLAEAEASAEAIARIEDVELPFIPTPDEREYERALVAADVGEWY